MSIAPECIFANEAGIPYAAIAMATDLDSWKDEAIQVTWEGILRVFEQNAENVKKLLIETVRKLSE